MAIRQRYYAPIQSRSGDLYKLSVWDLDHQSAAATQSATWGWQSSSDGDAKEIDTVYDSVEVVWDGDNGKVHQPIIGSTLRVTFLAERDDELGILKALRKDKEFRVGIKLERYNYTSEAYDPYWYGVVLPEAVSVDFSDHPTVINITATDGLSTLRDKPYVDTDDSLYAQTTATVHATARKQIGNCFKHLPNLALWGETEDFFFECVDLFHESHATLDGSNNITAIESITDNVGCNQNIWYEERDVSPPFFRETEMRTTGATCYDVIANWMTTLGLRMCHSNGAFLAVSPFADKSNIRSRLFRNHKRAMTDPSFQASDSVSYSGSDGLPILPDDLDLTSETILEGSTRSYLHPVKGVFYKHLQGGAARLFSEVKWVAIDGDFPQTDLAANVIGQIYDISENYTVQFPLQNDEAIVPTAVGLRMVGTLQHFFRPADTSDEDTAIGAQFEVKMKVKCGQYYLKQSVGLEADANLNNDSDFGTIVKTGSDITTWKPLVITDDVAWTTNSSDTFSFPAFLDGSRLTPGLEKLQYDAGNGNIVEYPPGFGCMRHPDHPNKQRYNSSSRGQWLQAYEVDLDFALPDLPTTTPNETGVEITVEVIMYKNDGTSTSTGSQVFPTNPTRPDGARIIGFNLFVGDGADEGDAFYYAELDAKNGREMILGGESLVASRVVEDYGEIGVITANTAYTHKWHSENDFTFNSGQRNLAVLAEEHIRLRGAARDTYSMRFLVSSSELALPHPLHTIKFAEGTASTFMRPFTMSHAISENLIVAEGYKVGRENGPITAVNDANKKKGGTNSSGGGGITGTTPVFKPRNTAGSSLPGIAGVDQTKLDYITVNANVDLADVAVNNTKVSYTDQAAVADNSLKVSFPGFGSTAGTALAGDTNTLADISNLGSVLRTDGSGTAVDGIKAHANQLTLVADSTIPGQTGSKRFTLQDFFTAIVTSGLEEADSGGFVDIADYVGATSGVVGDFNDDGQVGSADLLQFLILYGQIFEGDNGAFANSYLQIQGNSTAVNFPDTTARTLTWSNSNVPANLVVQSGVSINILDASDEIEFVSGATTSYPITAWTHKRVVLRRGGSASNPLNFLGVQVTFPSTRVNIGVSIKALKADGTDAQDETVELMGTVFIGPANSAYGIPFDNLVGLNKWTSSTDLSDPLIEKIRVSIFAQPVDSGDVLSNVALTNVRIGLESVSS